MLCLLRLRYINRSFSGQHSCESLDAIVLQLIILNYVNFVYSSLRIKLRLTHC